MNKSPENRTPKPASAIPEAEVSSFASPSPSNDAEVDQRYAAKVSSVEDLPDIDRKDLLGEQSSQNDREDGPTVALPDHVAGSGSLDRLVSQARDYAEAATAENTNKAYKADWKHYVSWCRRKGVDALVPSPAVIGLYIADCAKPQDGSPALSVSTIERRLSGISSNYRQRGLHLDLKDRHIAAVWTGIKKTHGKPPAQKEAVLAADVLQMVSSLTFTLRDLRDRAILLLGYAGGLRRTEIIGLDVGKGDTDDGRGWLELLEGGVVLHIKGKTGWREVEIGRGSSDQSCPVHALEQWLHFAKIEFGPVFRRVTQSNAGVGSERLSDKHVARLIKRLVLDAGIGLDRPALAKLSDAERVKHFAGHSLRAGLASAADVDERYVQKQLGHASAEMTRRYQRHRDRFRVNLTKAAGL